MIDSSNDFVSYPILIQVFGFFVVFDITERRKHRLIECQGYYHFWNLSEKSKIGILNQNWFQKNIIVVDVWITI